MAASVMTNLKALAMYVQGEPLYALFDESYSKNLHPRTPEWCCIGVGRERDVIAHVARLSAAADEGSLQSPQHRAIPAASYIAKWQAALDNALQLPDVAVDLKFSTSWMATLPLERIDVISTILWGFGLTQLLPVEGEPNKTVTITLSEHTDLFLALYGCNGPLESWRAIPAHMHRTSVAFSGARSARDTVSWTMPRLRFFSINDTDRIVYQFGEEPIRVAWRYEAKSNFISAYLPAIEYSQRGASRKAMRVYDQALICAQDLPLEARVHFIGGPFNNKTVSYALRTTAIALQKELGIDIEEKSLCVSWGDIFPLRDVVRQLSNLNPSNMVIELPSGIGEGLKEAVA